MAVILECKIVKIQIGFLQGLLGHKVDTIPLRFSSFHILLFLVTKAILTGLILFNSKTAQCKNQFDTNLIKSIQPLL